MGYDNMEEKNRLVSWLLNLIQTSYKEDVALVIHCNSLKAPGDEFTPFPEFFIHSTERGKELACSYIIGGVSHDFFYRSWDYFTRFENLTDYDTMIFADSSVIYSRSEEDLARYNDIKKKLFENLNNADHMREVAIKDYKWAEDVYRSGCLATSLSQIMMDGGYVCDLLVHSLAGINQKYIPHSFSRQFDFLQSCVKKPDDFVDLYLKINKSRNASEIRESCAKILISMKRYLCLDDKEKKTEIDGIELARWYEEIINDWRRIRGFIRLNDLLSARGWATKLQYALDNAAKNFGIDSINLLEKFDMDNIDEFLAYAEKYENDIRDIISKSGAKLNEFDSVDEFTKAYEGNEIIH